MLASGSVGISKPPELAPLTSLKLVDLWNKTEGVVPGVLNCLPGLGPEAGEALVDHPDVRKIAGSDVTLNESFHLQKWCQNITKYR